MNAEVYLLPMTAEMYHEYFKEYENDFIYYCIETNVEVKLVNGFREQIEYKFPNRENVIKQSVYFLGEWIGNDIKCQEQEVSEAKFVTYDKALELLSFDETKDVLKKVHKFIFVINKE